MREIPVEVLTLLKSRSMIGDNKPNHIVEVDGLYDGYEWDKVDTVYQPIVNTTDCHPSCVKLSDGRILYMYSRGEEPGAIYQAFAPDLETFVTRDNSVEGEEVVLSNLYYPRATIFKTPNNDLFFIVTYRKTTTETVAKTIIYRSILGDGSDWKYYSTIQTFDWTNLGDWNVEKGGSVGAPYFINNRWIIICRHYYSIYDSVSNDVGMFYSDDEGYTWITSFTRKSYPTGTGITDPRNIVYFKNALWWLYKNSWYAGTYSLLKSTDYGTTWVEIFNKQLFVPNVALIADEKYLYMFNSDGIFVTDIEPTKYEDFILLNNQANPWNNTIVVDVDDKIVCLGGSSGCGVLGIKIIKKTLPVKSISISRNKNMAGSLNSTIDNKNGEWSPDNTVNQNVLFPNKQIIVKQGYGSELVQTFKGLIDRIEMNTFPQELKLSVRDKLKLALDQTITSGASHVITYTSQTVEGMFLDLCTKAGLSGGTIEETGITLAEKVFSWESYADCFQWLADLVGFEYGADEDGFVYFRKDTAPVEPVAVYTFREGEDIISLGYTIDDNDIYSKVVVYGKDSNDNVISAYKDYVSKDYYNVLSQKIMKIDVGEASTVEQLQAIADRAEMLMRSRVREVNFAAIAIPWLQVGDLIKVIESSTTISEIYRITDLSTTYDSKGYTMQISCYHHSA